MNLNVVSHILSVWKTLIQIWHILVQFVKKNAFLRTLKPQREKATHLQFASSLMSYAGTHLGHISLETHEWIIRLRNGDCTQNQIAQFIWDRIFICQALERCLQSSPYASNSIFCRSHAYKQEWLQLCFIIVKNGPTDVLQNTTVSLSAKKYIDYIENASKQQQSTHLWLFLVGETFGAQVIGNNMNHKFGHNLGSSIREYHSFKFETTTTSSIKRLRDVRLQYNQWFDSNTTDGGQSRALHEREIGLAYDFLVATFDSYIQ